MNVQVKKVVVYVAVFFALFVYQFGVPRPGSTDGADVLPAQDGDNPDVLPTQDAVAHPTPIPVIPTNGRAHLVSKDGWVPLLDSPCNDQIVRFHLPVRAKVIVRESHLGCDGKLWYRVEFADGSEGWVPTEVLHYDGP